MEKQIMKKVFFTLVLIPFIGFGQMPSNDEMLKALNQWVFFSGGNPIDGFNRHAARINNEQDIQENIFLLKVESSSETLEIKNKVSRDNNDRDNIHIELRTFGTFEDIDEVYMYFDNEKIFYKVNYRKYSSMGMLLWNAVESNDEGFLTRFNIIQKLKSKNTLFLRFKYKNGKQINASFDLQGSSNALNQVFTIPNIDDKDYFIDMALGVVAKAQFSNTTPKLSVYLDGKLDSLITHYLDSTISRYHPCFILDFELVGRAVKAYNLNSELVTTINYSYFNRNNRIVNNILETLYSSSYCQNTFSNFDEFVIKLEQDYLVTMKNIENSLPNDVFDDSFTFYDYILPLSWYINGLNKN